VAYRVDFVKSAAKALEDFPAKTQQRLRVAIEALSANPRPFGLKKLKGRENEYRVRVGDFRIIYAIFDAEERIIVREVTDRKDAY